MKKFNFIIGKKQIIIASLVLILGVAIYLNWQFASSDKALTVADVLGAKSQTSSSPKYGEAQLVDANKNSSESNTESEDYFTKARMDKKASQDEASESLEAILSKSDISDEERANATAQSIRISEMSQKETSIEEQVKAKGFDDCVAYVESDRVNVTVKAENGDITAQQAAQIKDIIINTTGVDASNIVVTPVS